MFWRAVQTSQRQDTPARRLITDTSSRSKRRCSNNTHTIGNRALGERLRLDSRCTNERSVIRWRRRDGPGFELHAALSCCRSAGGRCAPFGVGETNASRCGLSVEGYSPSSTTAALRQDFFVYQMHGSRLFRRTREKKKKHNTALQAK